MLFWHDGGKGPQAGFYCDSCWNEHDELWQIERDGPSLSRVLDPMEAAAPDMLEALEDVCGTYGHRRSIAVAKTNAVIAKAKGENRMSEKAIATRKYVVPPADPRRCQPPPAHPRQPRRPQRARR